MSRIGIIGGSGLTELPGLHITDEREVHTPFGVPSAPFLIGTLGDKEVAFLSRHGIRHHIQPHAINYRANIWGFRELDVTRIVAISASGGISPRMKPGTIVMLDQLMDFNTGAREGTFYDTNEVVHVDFAEPYCPELRRLSIAAAKSAGVSAEERGTYICTNGPRLETSAEIKHFAGMGVDLVGMTALPEAALAREAEMCYGGISIVTNFAAGIADRKLTTDEVVSVMKDAHGRILRLLAPFIASIPEARTCPCKDALEGAKM